MVVLALVLWCTGDGSPVGHFASASDKDRFMAAYRTAMAALPNPSQTRDIRTTFGIVRVYRFTGAHDADAPLVLLPGRAAPTPVWADNLPGLLALRSVYTIDLLGEPGMSIQDRPITDDADQAAWLHEVLAQLPGPATTRTATTRKPSGGPSSAGSQFRASFPARNCLQGTLQGLPQCLPLCGGQQEQAAPPSSSPNSSTNTSGENR